MIIAFAGKPEKETKPGLQIYSDAQKKDRRLFTGRLSFFVR